MINEEKIKKKLKEVDERLDKDLLSLFELDKHDEIVLTKEDFKQKMLVMKIMFTTSQMEVMTEGFDNLKI